MDLCIKTLYQQELQVRFNIILEYCGGRSREGLLSSHGVAALDVDHDVLDVRIAWPAVLLEDAHLAAAGSDKEKLDRFLF